MAEPPNSSTAPLGPDDGALPPIAGILPTGTVVADRYRVVDLIAEGGMSIVYGVEDLRLPNRLVLKQMREVTADAEAHRQVVEQFRREGEVLARLSHVNLPRVSDAFEWRGGRFIVMQHVDGRTVEALLVEKSPRDEAEVVAWAEQICIALGYLHGEGLVYRDLKPSNVMLNAQGEVRLIDFGIVRSFSLGKSRDTVVMGTPGFAAPEQYGTQQSDPRSDLFALGVFIHHCLTGHDPSARPFIFPPVRTLNPLVSERLERTVTQALQIDPTRRFASAEEMRAALVGRLAPGDVQTFRYVGKPPSRRRAFLTGAVALAVGGASVLAMPWTPVAAAAGCAYTPFWLWLLLRDYRQRCQRVRMEVRVDRIGLTVVDSEASTSVAWADVTAVEQTHDGLDQSVELRLLTRDRMARIPLGNPTILPSVLDPMRLEGADELIALVEACRRDA